MDINSILSSGVASQKVQLNDKSVAPEMVKQQQTESSVVPSTTEASQATVTEMVDSLSKLNQQLANMGQTLSFAVDENTQSSVIKVVDKTTDEVIKQFPTEGSLRIIKNIQDYLMGMQQQGGSQTKEGLTGVLINEII